VLLEVNNGRMCCNMGAGVQSTPQCFELCTPRASASDRWTISDWKLGTKGVHMHHVWLTSVVVGKPHWRLTKKSE
jgi:hypothetical protein